MSRSFNGSTDLINLGTSTTLQPSHITISAWINVSSLTPSYSAVVSCITTSGTLVYQIFVKSSGKLAMYIRNAGGSTTFYDGTGSHTLSTNSWYNLVLVFGNGALTGYVNGASDGSSSDASTLGQTATAATELGNDAHTSGRNFGGRMADIAIFDVCLTVGEIAALAAGARAPYVRPGSLVGYWPLDGLASPEPDLSGNKFNGTLTGTTLGPGAPISLLTPRWPQSLIISAAPTFTWFPMGADSNDFINRKADVIGY